LPIVTHPHIISYTLNFVDWVSSVVMVRLFAYIDHTEHPTLLCLISLPLKPRTAHTRSFRENSTAHLPDAHISNKNTNSCLLFPQVCPNEVRIAYETFLKEGTEYTSEVRQYCEMSESANFAKIDRSIEAAPSKNQDKQSQNGAFSPADSSLAGDCTASSQKDDDAMISTALSAAAAASAAAAKYKESRKKTPYSKYSSRHTNTIKKHRYSTKKAKDMPRRPISAYNYFFKEERTRVLAEREAAWVGRTRAFDADVVTDGDAPNNNRDTEFFTTLGKTIARRWKGLPEKDRERFYAMAADDLARYRLEMKLYYDNYNEAISSSTAHYKAGEIAAFQAFKSDNDSSNTLSSNATGASSFKGLLKPHHLNLQFANQSQTRTDTAATQRSVFPNGMSRLANPPLGGTSSSSEPQFFGRQEGLPHTNEANRLNLPAGEIEQQQFTHQFRMLREFYNYPLNWMDHQHHSGSKSSFVSSAQRQKSDQQQATAPWSVAAEQSSSSSRLLMDALIQHPEPSQYVSSASQAIQQMSKQQHGFQTNHHQLLQQLQEQQPHMRSTDIFSIILPPQHQDQDNRGISKAFIPGQFLQSQSNSLDWSQLLAKADCVNPPYPPDASFDADFQTSLLSSHDRYELEGHFLTASDQTNQHFAQFSSATSGGAASSCRGSGGNLSNLLQQGFSVPSLSPSDSSIMIPQLDQQLQSVRQDQPSMELSAGMICPRQAAGLLCFCGLCTARI